MNRLSVLVHSCQNLCSCWILGTLIRTSLLCVDQSIFFQWRVFYRSKTFTKLNFDIQIHSPMWLASNGIQKPKVDWGYEEVGFTVEMKKKCLNSWSWWKSIKWKLNIVIVYVLIRSILISRLGHFSCNALHPYFLSPNSLQAYSL